MLTYPGEKHTRPIISHKLSNGIVFKENFHCPFLSPVDITGSALEVHNAISTLAFYSPAFVIGSLTAYLVSQSFDVWFFNWLKQKTNGSKLWLRNNLSTMTSQLIDTLIYQFTWVIATGMDWSTAFMLAMTKYVF